MKKYTLALLLIVILVLGNVNTFELSNIDEWSFSEKSNSDKNSKYIEEDDHCIENRWYQIRSLPTEWS